MSPVTLRCAPPSTVYTVRWTRVPVERRRCFAAAATLRSMHTSKELECFSPAPRLRTSAAARSLAFVGLTTPQPPRSSSSPTTSSSPESSSSCALPYPLLSFARAAKLLLSTPAPNAYAERFNRFGCACPSKMVIGGASQIVRRIRTKWNNKILKNLHQQNSPVRV